LKWVQASLLPGARLMDIDHFNRAVQTFDTIIWAHSSGNAIVMLWAALEALFRPGRANVTKTLAACMATFLYPPGGGRDRMYQKVERLYEARGSAAHNSQVPATEQLRDSFLIAGQCITKCIESAKLPDPQELASQWKERR
jgi:Apea-like HEPN